MLADILATPPATRHGLPCSVATLLASLDDRNRAALQAAIDDPRWTEPALLAVVAEAGHTVATTAIGHHRRGRCRCAR